MAEGVRYQPKGGMCRSCAYRGADCSTLPFHTMKPIERTGEAVIVRCTAFKRRIK